MITICWTKEIMKTIMIEKHFNKASDTITRVYAIEISEQTVVQYYSKGRNSRNISASTQTPVFLRPQPSCYQQQSFIVGLAVKQRSCSNVLEKRLHKHISDKKPREHHCFACFHHLIRLVGIETRTETIIKHWSVSHCTLWQTNGLIV